jgi:hypothetical protein
MVDLFTYEYTGNEGTEFKIVVRDKDSDTGPDADLLDGMPFKVSYDMPEGFNPTAPVQFSKCAGGIEISNSTEEGYLDTIIQGGQDQFYLFVYADNVIFWRGIVNVGLIVKPRESYPYLVTLQATDGLTRLNDIKISMAAAAGVNIITYVKQVLNTTSLLNAFSDDEIYLITCCRLYENTMQGAFSSAVDPLRYTRINSPEKLAIQSDNNGEEQYRTQEKLLKDLLIAFGLQLRFKGGVYHLMQIDAYDLPTLKLHQYTKLIDFNPANPDTVTAGAATAVNFNHAIAIANHGQVLAGDSYTYAPPLREVEIEREDFIGRVIQPFSYFDDYDTEISLGSVVSGNNAGLQFQLGIAARWTNTSAPANFLVEFRIKIKVGTNVFTNKNGLLQWVAAAGGDYYSATATGTAAPAGVSGVWFTPLPLNQVATGYHAIDTPLLLAGGALSIDIEVKFSSLAGQDITGAFTVNDIDGTTLALYKNFTGFDDNAVTLFFGRNTSSSYVLNLGAISIGDDPGTNSSGKLQVYDGSGWDDASSWRRFSVSNPTNRLLLLVIEIIYRRQQKALAILNAGLIRNDISTINTITVDGFKLLMQGGVYDTDLEQWEPGTTWIELQAYNTEAGPNWGELIGPPKSLTGNTASSLYGKTDTTLAGLLPIGRSTEVVSGTVESVAVSTPGINVGQADDIILIINPLTGQQEELTLSAPWLSSEDTIEVNSIALQNVYPLGSIISVNIKTIISRLYALENT